MNRTTQDTLAKNIRAEEEWVDMLPTVAFSHRCSQSASTGYSPIELITGHVPKMPIDVSMKYPDKSDLERELTEEEVQEIEDECLSWNVSEMKKVKEATIGNAKVNISNAQIRQKRNYDKRYEEKDQLDVGDIVLYEYQRNKNRKGGKMEKRFSGPYELKYISKAGNCLLEHLNGGTKKQKVPLAHLHRFHERILEVDSNNGGMSDFEDEHDVLFKRDGCEEEEEEGEKIGTLLDKFDDHVQHGVMGRRGKNFKQENSNTDSKIIDPMKEYLLQESIAEKMGLKIKEICYHAGKVVDKKEKKTVSFADEVTTHKYVPEDALQCIREGEGFVNNNLFDGEEWTENGLLGIREERKSTRTSRFRNDMVKSIFTDDLTRGTNMSMGHAESNAEDNKLFTEDEIEYSSSFKENKDHDKIRTGQLNNIFTGEKIHFSEHFSESKNEQIVEKENAVRKERAHVAKQRLTLKSRKRRIRDDMSSRRNTEDKETEEKRLRQLEDEMERLKRSLAVENDSSNSPKCSDDDEEQENEVEVIDICSSDSSKSDAFESKEYIPTPGLPGNKRAKFVFIPLGPSSRERVSELFNINVMKPLPNYDGCMLNCPQTKPQRVKGIGGRGNCLFNAISWSVCGDQQFQSQVRNRLCDFIA